ncbi:heterokaryon incompatibility protein-domain-containing protein [Astrocystis sublimbata]|nr:heterokaryon incompatibility protein-domain-containing protein [Astrocystis sublimbata]KAI0195927.1 heterokaryon incompatibility protein-domain-containing protein [Astrocystis sublimbata]
MSQGDDGRAAVVQDAAEPLGQIRDRDAGTGSIASAILDIQKHAITRTNWIKSLECLYLATGRDDGEPTGKRRRLGDGDTVAATYSHQLLRRTYLDPVSDPERGREYVAVSYTWDLSEDESSQQSCQSFGGYYVESRRTGEPAQPSNVRDVVLERAFHYAKHVKCETIWIDRECVNHHDAKEKETAIQNMHLVYTLSRRPIALLTHTIQTAEQLDLIVGLLVGDLREEEGSAALELLDEITSDLWWQRAWTFQEDYRASTRMTLLIPHASSLEHRKQNAPRDMLSRPLLGTLPGEISIKSVDFRRRATEFCLQYKQSQPEAEAICDRILSTAGKYNVLLQDDEPSGSPTSVSRSMTPTILADIGRRGILTESDRLAIAANVCGYTIRLDTIALNKCGSSLSLSLLALYLLNGEIMENCPRSQHGTLRDSVFTYLTKQSLRSFRPPIDEGLTFIKSCRFVDPVLTSSGTQTWGHLWRLGKIIRPCPLKRNKYRTLSPLETLATDLQYKKYGKAYTELAAGLLAWVQECAANARLAKQQRYGGRNPLVHPRQWGWRSWMADEVEAALLEGKALRLASVVDPGNREAFAPYSAIFVGDHADDWKDEEKKNDVDGGSGYASYNYVFTSIRPPKENARYGETPKHVSLEVELVSSEAQQSQPQAQQAPGVHEKGEHKTPSNNTRAEHSINGPVMPKLYIKRWLNGLCFPGGFAWQPVMFPWPADLLATSTNES